MINTSPQLRSTTPRTATGFVALSLIVGWAAVKLLWAAYRQWGTTAPQNLDAGLSARNSVGVILSLSALAGVLVTIGAAVVVLIDFRASRGLAVVRPLVFVAAAVVAAWTTVVTLRSGSDAIGPVAAVVVLICLCCLLPGRSLSKKPRQNTGHA